MAHNTDSNPATKLSWYERVVQDEAEETERRMSLHTPEIERMSVSPLQMFASSSSQPPIPYNTIPYAGNISTSQLPTNVLYKKNPSYPVTKTKTSKKPEYFIRPYSQNIFTLETSSPQYDLFNTIQNYFGTEWFYKPWDLSKTPNYYQAILTITGSAKISHNYLPPNKKIPAYSQCKIFKVISPYDWFGPLSEPYAFPEDYKSEPFYKTTFNYWEYQQAWFNAFYIQNVNNQHTWLMYFDPQEVEISKFPTWWCQWWECFGSVPEIQKAPVLESYTIFKSKFKPTTSEARFNSFAHFSTNFNLPWIVNWFLEISDSPIPTLRRKYQVRWWDKYNVHKDLQPRHVEVWIQDQMERRRLKNSNQDHIQQPQAIPALDKKQKFAALLAASLTDPDLQQLLAQHTANSQKSTAPSTSSTNNDDDDPDFLI